MFFVEDTVGCLEQSGNEDDPSTNRFLVRLFLKMMRELR